MRGRVLILALAGLALAGCRDPRSAEQQRIDDERAEAFRDAQERYAAYFRDLEIARVCAPDAYGNRVFIYRGQDARLWMSTYSNATASKDFEPVSSGISLSEVC